jgi:hypothetical protein
VRLSFFRPVPGLANAARLLPTALRRRLLSFALRALRGRMVSGWYPARDPEGTPATGACWAAGPRGYPACPRLALALRFAGPRAG